VRVVLVSAGGALLVGLVVGFVGFAQGIANAALPGDPRAEGIVVLTGGSARIDGALQLLAEGRAGRMLISGVNPAVTKEGLARTITADLRPALECCVDLDHARDTIENASETKRWVDARGLASLIVVTSAYHMPRSLAELADAMPRTRLVPFPVSSPGVNLQDWWRDPTVFALVLREYGKFLLAEARQTLAPLAAPG